MISELLIFFTVLILHLLAVSLKMINSCLLSLNLLFQWINHRLRIKKFLLEILFGVRKITYLLEAVITFFTHVSYQLTNVWQHLWNLIEMWYFNVWKRKIEYGLDVGLKKRDTYYHYPVQWLLGCCYYILWADHISLWNQLYLYEYQMVLNLIISSIFYRDDMVVYLPDIFVLY